MEKIFLNLFILTISLLICCTSNGTVNNDKQQNNTNTQMANPAACYCEQMGYKSVGKINPQTGAEYGVCILPNGIIAEEFQFFRGEIYPEYSYFAKYAYESLIDTITDQYGQRIPKSFIIKRDSQNRIIEKITLNELMNRNGDTLCNGKLFFEEK